MKKIFITLICILPFSTAWAGKDYGGKYLLDACEKTDNQLCQGYLLGVLDMMQYDDNHKLCLCSGACGLTAIDTGKLAAAFPIWMKAQADDRVMKEMAENFIANSFACSRTSHDDFLK